jgi:hypothetical protein
MPPARPANKGSPALPSTAETSLQDDHTTFVPRREIDAMRTGNRMLIALAVAGALCSAAMSPAQDKKAKNGKKPANGAPPIKAKDKGKAPDAEGPAPVAEPAPLPTAPPGVIPGLEYNYYYPPPGAGEVTQVPAQLYLCPSPYPPPYVGYTWISYPPFQPHEWLWIHRRAYYRFHPGGGMTMTSIRWEYHEGH